MLFSAKKCTALIISCTLTSLLVAQASPLVPQEVTDGVRLQEDNPVAVRYTLDAIKLTTQEIMGGESVPSHTKCSSRQPQRIAGDSLVVEDHFLGAQKQESAQINTDTSGCVGTEQFLVCIKGRVRTFNKKTGEPDHVLNVSLDRFFRAIAGGPFVSDPRPLFDAHSKRWYIMAINAGGVGSMSEGSKGEDEEGGSGDDSKLSARSNRSRSQAEDSPDTTGIPNVTRLLFVVSDSDIITPETVWSFYILDNTSDKPEVVFFDFETLGWDEDAVYVGSNPVLKSGQGQDSNFYVIQKQSLLNGGPAAVSVFYNLSTQFNMFTPQPASNFDTGGHVGYVIAYDFTSTRRVLLSQVLNPGSLTPELTAPVAVPTPRHGGVITPPALGSVNPIGALGDRMTSAPHIRNGHLWAVSDVGMDSTGLRPDNPADIDRVGGIYFKIDVTNPEGPFEVTQSGSLFDSAESSPRSYFFNSIMTNSDERVLLGATTCGETERLNGAVALLLDDQSSFETVLYTNSTTNFNPTDDTRTSGEWRWGDYSLISVDPEDTKKLWAIEMYCFDTNTWGVEVAQVSITPPAVTKASTKDVTKKIARSLSQSSKRKPTTKS